MTMEDTKTKTVVEDLYQTLQDGHLGFSRAAEKLAEDGHDDIASKMRDFSQQRQRMARELIERAQMAGITVETDEGSAAGALHRGWIAMKDALTGDDAHAVLAAAERGEDHAVAEYQDALEAELPAELKAFVDKQALEVKSAHDTVKQLRDANA